MALGKVVLKLGSGRKSVWINKQSGGRMGGRYCLRSNGNKPAFPGGSDLMFWGCFKSKPAAIARAKKLMSKRKTRR